MPVGRSDFEDRKENRIDRYRERKYKAKKNAEAQHKKADEIGSGIPFGQPILVGHHSEKKHRAAVKKIQDATRKAIAEYDKADYYADKIDAIENNRAISSDDPEAVNLYKEKLARLEASQKRMKAVNAYWRKNKTMKGFPGISDEEAAKIDKQMETAYSWVQKNGPYEDFRLKNNNAEIRRIKAKLETLSKLDGMEAETIPFKGGEMRIDLEINRVQFLFEGKPSDTVRSLLKKNGFRWAPSECAWQRQRTEIAVRIAKGLIPQVEEK